MDIRKLVECSNFGRYGHRAALPGIEFIEFKGYVASLSSTCALNEIMEALKDDGVNMIGVWGMGGVGKTTLLKEVGNEAKRLQLVDRVIMVVISQSPDIETIQGKIADFLDLQFERKTKEGKAEELWLQLEREEKFLIMLDDVWSELNLKAIGIPSGQNHKGCTIIFTTRSRRVCESMGSQIAVSLGVWDEDEGWKLFRMNASLENASPDIIEVAKDVSKECVGLPLAIVTLARALRSTEDLNEWELALKELRSARLMDFDLDFNFEINVYRCLEISYRHLRSKTTKKCLLLCSFYPEDHLIDEEDLVRYAWGLGLYHDAGSIKQVRSKVLGDLQHLKDSNLLLEDDQTSLVRLQLLEINGCGELKQIVKELEDDEQETMNFVKSPCFPELRAVEIYNCDNLDYIFPNFISPQSLPRLKRLLMQNLSQLKQIWSPAKQREEDAILQHQLQALPSLTELKVRRCPNLTDAAELGSARVHLEDVQLSKLKEASIINPKVLSLKKIRTQSRNLIPEVYGDGLNELTFLELGFCDSLEYLVDTTKEHVPDCALTNLVELSMGEMRGLKMLCNGLFPKHFLGNLKKLTVKRCDQLEALFMEENHAQIILSNLEHLELDSLPKLRWMLIGSAYYVSLQSLKVVNISRCQELRFLFSLSLVQSMVQLEKLQIEGCERLEALFEDLESDGDCHDLHPPCLPRLLTLRISKCPRLEYVLPITLAQGLPRLQSVWVSNSPQIKQVFGATEEHDGVEYSIKLPCLERLELHNLTNLSSFCQQNYFLMAPALEILSVSATPQFKKCTIQRQVNNNSRLHFEGEILLNAKDLTLNRVMNQKSLIPDVVVEGLTSLKLKDCEDLECLADTIKENVPNRGMLPNLVELIMKNMIGFKKLCKGQPPKGFLRNLEMLTVERCMDIVSLSPVAQNLQKLKLEDCEKLQEVFQIDDLLYSRDDDHAPLLSNLDYLELVSVPELRWILKGPSQYVSLQSLKLPGGFNFKLSLENMELGGLTWLRDIWNVPNQVVVTNLRELRVYDCSELTYIFPVMLVRNLPELRILKIWWCENLKQIIVNDDISASSSSQGHDKDGKGIEIEERISFPQLKELWLEGLPSLTSFSPVGYHLSFPSLDSLVIEDCSQMITSFTVDSTSCVHARTKAPGPDDISPSILDTYWRSHEATSLPPVKLAVRKGFKKVEFESDALNVPSVSNGVKGRCSLKAEPILADIQADIKQLEDFSFDVSVEFVSVRRVLAAR
ncbi:hypothetical protein PTKIN_Ptkin14bG0063500 [Pterospermum kingtungense]